MTWRLWRQDDNGNRFLAGEFARREDAERRLAELTRSLHKQTYWIDREEAGEWPGFLPERPGCR